MREIPTCVVMLTASGLTPDIAKAEEAGAMAYVVKPVSGDQIFPAMEMALKRFEEFKALQKEVTDLREALTTRKLVEKARGILMEKANLSEADAFKRLQKMAMDKRLPLKIVAEKIISTAENCEELFQAG
jgi:AmiR/NasT family two-component response regulator